MPAELKEIPRPWYENPIQDAKREGKYGEIMPEDEFLGLIKAVDSFELVLLEENFQAAVKEKLLAHPVVGDLKELAKLDKNPAKLEDIQN